MGGYSAGKSGSFPLGGGGVWPDPPPSLRVGGGTQLGKASTWETILSHMSLVRGDQTPGRDGAVTGMLTADRRHDGINEGAAEARARPLRRGGFVPGTFDSHARRGIPVTRNGYSTRDGATFIYIL